jgi:DNA-directed RNA polymerase subunit L
MNSETTMENSFDISLEDENYTIGKVLEYFLYEKFYLGDKSLSFCGFKKFHPHDDYSIVRVSYIENVSTESIYIDLQKIINGEQVF